MKNDFRYCIPCGRICSVIDVDGAEMHFADHHIEELNFCYGTFTYSTPPELPENWEELVTEPSAEELQLMDLNAQEILLDFAVR